MEMFYCSHTGCARGRAHTRNAIKLLEIIGFSKEIIRKADDMAGAFLRTGEWKAI